LRRFGIPAETWAVMLFTLRKFLACKDLWFNTQSTLVLRGTAISKEIVFPKGKQAVERRQNVESV
jgi:hypothetical protein